MTPSKRTFLALPLIPVEPAADKAKELKHLLRKYRIKWVNPESYHLTLFFFGEVPMDQLAELKDAIRSAVEGMPAFSFKLTNPGLFKRGHEPRVLWLGIEAPEILFDLKKRIDREVEPLGFISNEKFFNPHLTIGRFIPGQIIEPSLNGALTNSRFLHPVQYVANEIVLFESRLSPHGASYYPLEIFSLQSDND
ncbi:MAG TPA: RNA 2',3'-cyclic phosphodiesterase [Dysgonamonadaceae bacterium]|nr:RNA 2',3'-cyclic phosphodiesterase [Dysgonamonadaceae bacterium]